MELGVTRAPPRLASILRGPFPHSGGLRRGSASWRFRDRTPGREPTARMALLGGSRSTPAGPGGGAARALGPGSPSGGESAALRQAEVGVKQLGKPGSMTPAPTQGSALRAEVSNRCSGFPPALAPQPAGPRWRSERALNPRHASQQRFHILATPLPSSLLLLPPPNNCSRGR